MKTCFGTHPNHNIGTITVILNNKKASRLYFLLAGMIYPILIKWFHALSIKQTVHRAEDTADGCPGDVGTDAHTVGCLACDLVNQVDVGSCLRTGAGTKCVLVVVQDLNLDAKGVLKSSLYSVNGSVSNAFKCFFNAVV